MSRLRCLALVAMVGCTPPGGYELDGKAEEYGLIGSLLRNTVDYFVDLTNRGEEVPEIVPREDAPLGEDPAVDELFETYGLVEVDPYDEDASLDGAIVANYVASDPEAVDWWDDEVCYFSIPLDGVPDPDSLYMHEFYGFTAYNGVVDEDRVIYFVNGIKQDDERMCDLLQEIANTTCGLVVGVYNETESPAKDIIQTGFDRLSMELYNLLEDSALEGLGDIHNNLASRTLTHTIVQKRRQGQSIEIWAYSQGGAVTALALHRAIDILDDESISVAEIKVVTFGAAAPLWPDELWPDGPEYEHYVHVRDATPSLLGVGPLGNFVRFGGEPRAGRDAEQIWFDGKVDLEEYPPDFSVLEEVEPEGLRAKFSDLKGYDYHDLEGNYLAMYVNKHGSCVEKD